MQPKLVQFDGKLAIIFDEEMLKELDIERETVLNVSIEGRSIVITRAESQISDEEFRKALDYVNRKFASTLRRLAEYDSQG